MNRKATHKKTLALVGLSLALGLVAPVAAYAGSTGTAGQGGLGWREGAVALAIVLGVILLGVWGDVALGHVLAGVEATCAAVVATAAAAWRHTSRRSARPSSYPERLRPVVGRRR